MNFEIPRDTVEKLEELQSFIHQNLSDPCLYAPKDITSKKKVWHIAGEFRLPGLCIPQEFGGAGWSATETFLGLEILGRESPDSGFNFAIGAHLLACAVPIWIYGSDQIKQKYLSKICNGQYIAGNAMSEPQSGSDAYRMNSQVQKMDGFYLMKAAKNFVSNFNECDCIVIYAANDKDAGAFGGISAFLLDLSIHPVIKGEPIEKAGLDWCSLGGIFADDLQVEKQFLLGPEGRGAAIFNKSMEWERALLGAIHLGHVQKLLTLASKHLKTLRHTSPNPSLEHLKTSIAEWQARYLAIKLLALNTAWLIDHNKPATKESAMVKWMISDLYKEVSVYLCHNVHLRGEFSNIFEDAFRSSMASSIYSGTNEIMKIIVGQQLGL